MSIPSAIATSKPSVAKLTVKSVAKLTVKMVCVTLLALVLFSLSYNWKLNPYLSWIYPVGGVSIGLALIAQHRLKMPVWSVLLPVFTVICVVRSHQPNIPLDIALIWGVLNCAEIFLVWLLLRNDFSIRYNYTSQSAIRLIVVGLLGAPTISALIYCSVLWWLKTPDWPLFWPVFLRNASSFAIFTLSILFLSAESLSRLKDPWWCVRFVFAAVLHICLLMLVFYQKTMPYLFLFVPTLMFLVVKGRGLGAAVGMLSSALVAYVFTYFGKGPLDLISGPDMVFNKMLVLHLFLLTVACVTVSGSLMLESNIKLLKQLRDHETYLKDLAEKDPLTGLLNRRGLYRALQVYFDEGKPFSVILLDVDYFKKYNDLYGHTRGDECLVDVSNALFETKREKNSLILARLGGEEFLIVVPMGGEKRTRVIAEKALQNIREKAISHASSDKGIVTASAGVSVSLKDEKDIAPLLQRADLALYESKNRGRNQVVVYSDHLAAQGKQ